jgi:spore coat protein U-like protein
MSWSTACRVPLVALALLLASATARASCTVSVGGVAFGPYDVFGTTSVDATGTIVFQCGRPDRHIRITLSTGSSGTYVTRTLRRSANALTYNLYIGGFSRVWGDGTGSTSYYSINNPPDDQPVALTVYGRIPAGQDVPAGTYTDTVVAQIDF